MKYFFALLLVPYLTFSQVPVDINSGNPAFPFPQFLAYEYDGGHRLENLANQNPDGLVHAEMEKRIREAWLIMANRFQYSGESHAGVQYITENIGCPYDCTEGSGYGMIAAAYMADKTTFDGIWFRVHDTKMIQHPRYRDGVVPDPGYRFGDNSLRDNTDSAADGDFDTALGLLMAWKQWGDDSGHLDSSNNMISYKEEALNVIRGLVELHDRGLGDCRRTSGDIGFDGYIKGGNTGKELTDWASGQGQDPCPEFTGPTPQHIDYVAPAYFKAFAEFLETEGGTPDDISWNIPQFLRAEASSDWFMGALFNQGPNTVPVAGWVELDTNNNASFTNFQAGEDFRYAWRSILNHTWHGNPENSWDPITHQVSNGGNSFNKDMGERFSEFMTDPTSFGNSCVNPGGGLGMSFQGPSQLVWQYDPNTGASLGTFPLNWMAGTGSPSAVTAQDFDLMGKLYRQCAIEWDQTSGQNLDSNPVYFHGFFRLLGMLITTGNFQSPMSITPEANIKIYAETDKTFAFTGDEVTFTFSYRNYGSVSAQNVTIVDNIPVGLEFISSTGGGINSGGVVSWDVGTVPGFTTSGGIDATTGEVTATFRVTENFSGRICNPASISTATGQGWTSNEFPNNVTAVMEQNCVDIVEKALEIEKTVDHDLVNPGDIVTYTVNFENSSQGGYINGGRSGVNFAYARGSQGANGSTQGIKVRLYHGAAEPYVNYENYRISVFLNDNTRDCIIGDAGCTSGWDIRANIYEGGDPNGVQVSQEDIIPGSDARGAWNQRVIIQFADQLSGPTPHLLRYAGLTRIHEGGDFPLRAVWELFSSNNGNVDWSDDWSWDANASDSDGGFFYPITNDWTDPDNPNQIVGIYHNEACETPTKTVDNILVEEWDGFTWRRIYGSGPVPGRDVDNVVFTDVLPLGFEFVDFVGDDPLGIAATTTTLPDGRTEIRWEADRLQISQDIEISYRAIANFSSGTCERQDEIQTNIASIEADNETPILASADVTVTCNPVILPPPPSSMVKIATPTSAEVGDEIVYTLSYENTDGSPIEVDFATPGDWTAQNGAPMTISNGSLTNITNDPGVSTYDFSHGTNGTLEATIGFAANATFGFALRHTGGAKENGLYIVFKPNPGAGSIETIVYDGTTELDARVIGFPGNPMDIKLLLADDQLNVWVGNTTNPTPSWSVTGLPVRAGNYGFINGFPDGSDAFATHTVTRFKTSMDSAFNLQITDPIPSEVSFVSAANLGVNTAGIVTYPLIAGPILAGEIITYSWTSSIVSCPSDTSKIVNLAFTNILGVPENSISAQAIVDCSGQDLCSTLPDPPSVMDAVACVGDATIPVLSSLVTATETIIWYPDNTSNIPISEPIVDISVASENTYYVSQQDSNGCESDRAPLTVSVLDSDSPVIETLTILSNDSLQFDIANEFGITGDFTWAAIPTPTVDGETNTDSSGLIITDTLINNTALPQNVTYLITPTDTSSSPCGTKRFELIVTITPVALIDTTISASSVIEGEDIEVTIMLSEPSETDIILNISFTPITADGNDLDITMQIVTIPAGVPSFTFNRATIDDTIIENSETVEVAIDTVEEGNIGDFSSTDIATIFDNDGDPNIIIGDTIIIEGETFQVPISLTSPATSDISITIGFTDISTSPDDYQNDLQTVTFSTAEDAQTLLIPTIDDTFIEGTENFTVFVVSVDIGTVGAFDDTGIASIIDNDTTGDPIISIENGQTEEGDSIDFVVTLDQPATEDIIVTFTITDITTTALDYELSPTPFIIPAGETRAVFSFRTLEDAIIEEAETFNFEILDVVSGTIANPDANAIGTILDNNNVEIFISDAEAEEGQELEFSISLSTITTEDITMVIKYTDETTSASDYTISSTELTIPSGETNASIFVPTIDDTIIENDEVFRLEIEEILTGNINNFSAIGIGLITDNDRENTLFPKYFTPNGDGFHELWHAEEDSRNLVNNIWIYNREGKLLKQLISQGNGWDGNFNGQRMPSSEYWFRAELNDGTYQQGSFSLIR